MSGKLAFLPSEIEPEALGSCAKIHYQHRTGNVLTEMGGLGILFCRESLKRSPHDIEVDSFARKGGSAPGSSSDHLHMTSIRMPDSALEKIDELWKKRVGNVSRNTWILEAIEDKIKKES
jgi:hypothetical protein